MFEYFDHFPGEMLVGSVAVSWGFNFTQVNAVFGSVDWLLLAIYSLV